MLFILFPFHFLYQRLKLIIGIANLFSCILERKNTKRIVISFQFFKVLSEEGDASSKDRLDKEAALTNAVDATEASMKSIADSSCRGHEQKTRSEDNLCDTELKLYAVGAEPDGETKESSALLPLETQSSTALENEKPLEEASIISYQRKVTVLYTLLSACVADTAEVDKKFSKSRQGYDARHRVSLRLLAVWLGVEWNEMVCVLGTCACILNAIWYYILHLSCVNLHLKKITPY